MSRLSFFIPKTINQRTIMYGYSDETVGSNKVFGLNQKALITEFAWTNQGGKDGAEAEALDIKVLIEGDATPISYRQYPFTKAINFNDKNSSTREVTDPEHPVFKQGLKVWTGNITHIMKSLGITEDQLKAAFSVPIESFKEYCKILMKLLPKNFEKKYVDVFLQYQYTLKGKMTFLELPKNTKSGKFLVPHVKPVGAWKEVKDASGLKYIDDENNVHPFKRAAKYFETPYATQQFAQEDDVDVHSEDDDTPSTATGNGGDDW